MALNDNYRPLKYASNNTQKDFPVIWNVNTSATVIVATYTTKDELVKEYTQGTDFSYVPHPSPGVGGYVTTPVPPPAGEMLVITRDEPYTQWLELLNSGKLDLVAMEKALDHMMMCIQQNRDEAARAIKVPPSSAEPPELLATLIFDARDATLAAAIAAKISEQNALASEIEAEAAAAAAVETLELAQVVIAEDLAGAQGAIAADRANAQGAIATDKADAQAVIAADRASARDSIALDKADGLSAMSGARTEAIVAIQYAGDTQENRVNAAGAALVATGQDAVAQVNAAGTDQIKKIEETGSKTRIDVVLEGDAQVDRVTRVGAEYVRQTHEEAQLAKGEADRAEAAAALATDIAGVGIASATNYGLSPWIGEGLKVTTLEDGTKRLDAISQVTVVSTPEMTFPAEVAIGFPYTLSMTSGTLIPGAKLAGYEVVADGVDLGVIVANSEGVGIVQLTPAGVDLTAGNISAVAVDTEGNRSKIGYKTFLKHAVLVRAPHVLSPLTGDVDVALLPVVQIQAFNIYGMASIGVATQLQLATDELFANIVYDSGEEHSYATAITMTDRLPDGTEIYARARHKADVYGWSLWGAVEVFTTVPLAAIKPRVIAPVAGTVNQPVDVSIVLSGLETTGTPAVPTNTRVIVARDRELTDRVFDSFESGAYSTSVATSGLPIKTELFVTGQHKDLELGWTPLADVSTFTTLNAYVETPSIIAPTAVTDIGLKPLFEFSPFSNIGPADSHASTRFQISRDAGFLDLLVDTLITSGDKTRYQLETELALISTYYARVIYTGNVWGNSSYSAIYVFQTLDAFVRPPVLTGLAEEDVDVSLKPTITVGAFESMPLEFDVPKSVNNVQYIFTKTADGEVLESGYKTFAATGGTITPVENLPLFTDVTLKVNWFGERLTGAATVLKFKTIDAAVLAPTILSPTEGQTGVLLAPTITLSAFANVGPEDTPSGTSIRIYSDAALTVLEQYYDGTYITSWQVPAALSLETPHWIVAQHEGNLWGKSTNSEVRSFVTTSMGAGLPTMLAPKAVLRKGKAELVTNAFEGALVGHSSTDWKIEDTAGNILASVESSQDKLAHNFNLMWSTAAVAVSGQNSAWYGVTYGNGKFVAVGYAGRTTTSTDGLSWTPAVAVSGQTSNWTGLTYGNGKFVAVGEAGKTSTSADGISWTAAVAVSGQNSAWYGVTYGNGKFVAVGYNGKTSTSTDGLSWTTPVAASGQGGVWWGVTYANGKFVAVGDAGLTSTSTDGLSWTTPVAASGQTGQWYGVTYANGKFVAVGQSGLTSTSADGLTWTSAVAVSGQTSNWTGLTYGNGKFVAVGAIGLTTTSTDGLSWTPAVAVAGQNSAWYGVTYGNGKFVAVGEGGKTTTIDVFIDTGTQVKCSSRWRGTAEWSPAVAVAGQTSIWWEVTYGNGKFVAVGYSGLTSTSTDGLSWTTPVAVAGQGGVWFGVTYGNGKFVTVGQNGLTSTSADGLSWTAAVAVAGQLSGWAGVTYAAGKFVAVGGGGKTSTSVDGLSWTAVVAVSGQTGYWRGATYGNGKFVAVGDSGKTSTSTDGLSWTAAVVVAGQLSGWVGVTYGNGKFVAVGYSGLTSTSTDGLSWTPAVAVSGQTGVWRGVTYGNGKFVAVGDSGKTSTVSEGLISYMDIPGPWAEPEVVVVEDSVAVAVGDVGRTTTSTDGLTWTTPVAVSGQTGTWWGATCGNGKYVAVGRNSLTTTSTDGLTWTPAVAVSGQTGQWLRVAYGNGKFVTVGQNGLTSTSTDGLSWTTPVAVAGQTAYWWGFTYGNGKFVAVGDSGKTSTSLDGLSWTAAVAVAGQNSAWYGVTYGNGKFVAVGVDGKTSTSADGISWTAAVAVSGQNSAWWGATYGNGKFVAVGDFGRTSTSTDGLSWTTAVAVTGQSSYWYGATYGNGKFVAVGDFGRTTTSTDGLTWTPAVAVSGQTSNWTGLTYA